MKILSNVIIYQLIWFLCILGGNTGAMAALPLLVIHLLLSDKKGLDLKMMGFLLFLGLLVDGTLHQVGFFSFAASGFPIPLWLMVIWLGLAITPHHSLAWLQHRPVLYALLGAFGGPVAYWAGVRLGAASFNWPRVYSLAFLAVLWALIWSLVIHFCVISQPGTKTVPGRTND